MPHPLLILMPSGRRARVAPGTPLLDAARNMGVSIESICGGKLTCGKCKVQIEEGSFPKHGLTSSAKHLTPPGTDEQILMDRLNINGCRLSCVARIRGDVLAFVPEEARGQKQIIRKTAAERAIAIDPAVRKVYVEVEQATLSNQTGDWERLQDALLDQWNLADLAIDLHTLRQLQETLRAGKWSVTVTLWQDREVLDVEPGYAEGLYGLAVDVGSTTVAAHLCDLRTGAVLATAAAMNPQVTYGEDLMSRISYAQTHKNGLRKMHTAILRTLNKLARQAAREAGLSARRIHEIVLVGNTTMTHILLGLNPENLGVSPFTLAVRGALDIKTRDLGLNLHPAAYAHILPAEAGHIGADNVAALLAEELHHNAETTLLADIGTNAELALGNRDWLYSASSPTGPAFEGAQITHGMRAAPGAIERVRIDPDTKIARFQIIGEQKWSDTWEIGEDIPTTRQPHQLAAGICGSGIIEAIAEMYLAGILHPDGRFNPDVSSGRVQWVGRRAAYILATPQQTASGEPLLVTQADVRAIQLAKAALYAGAKLLMNQAGIPAVNRIILAGAFGSYIDPKYALLLGLIPDCALENIHAVGNAAGDGARIALLNRHKRAEAAEIARRVRYVETALAPDFQTEFVDALHLPHKRDPFPHLADLLPPQPVAVPPRPRARKHNRRLQNTD